MRCWLPVVAVATAATPAMSFAQTDLGNVSKLTGINPTALTVAGFSPADVGVFFGALRGSTEVQDLLARWHHIAAAEADLLAADEPTSPFDQAVVAARAQKELEVAAARQAFSNAVDAVIERGCHDLPAGTRDGLYRWRQAAPGLPADFRVESWTSIEVREIQAALLEERLAATSARAPKIEAAYLLAQVRGRAKVAEASVRLTSVLPQVEAAFAQQTD